MDVHRMVKVHYEDMEVNMIEVGNCKTCVFYKFPDEKLALHNDVASDFDEDVYALADMCKIGKRANDVYAPYDSFYRVNMELSDAVKRGFISEKEASNYLPGNITYAEYVKDVHFDQPVAKGGFRTEHDIYYTHVFCSPSKTVCPAYQLNPYEVQRLAESGQQ